MLTNTEIGNRWDFGPTDRKEIAQALDLPLDDQIIDRARSLIDNMQRVNNSDYSSPCTWPIVLSWHEISYGTAPFWKVMTFLCQYEFPVSDDSKKIDRAWLSRTLADNQVYEDSRLFRGSAALYLDLRSKLFNRGVCVNTHVQPSYFKHAVNIKSIILSQSRLSFKLDVHPRWSAWIVGADRRRVVVVKVNDSINCMLEWLGPFIDTPVYLAALDRPPGLPVNVEVLGRFAYRLFRANPRRDLCLEPLS